MKWMGLIAAIALLPLLSCAANDATALDNIAEQGSHSGGLSALPSLQSLEAVPARMGSFLGDVLTSDLEVAAQGASWDGDTLHLQQSGLSFSILAISNPGPFSALSVHRHISGAGQNVWVGVSDYGTGTWKWIGRLVPAAICRAGNYSSPGGIMYIAIVCSDGDYLDSRIQLATTEAAVVPPDGTTYTANIPSDLEDEYQTWLAFRNAGLNVFDYTDWPALDERRLQLYLACRPGEGGPSSGFVHDELVLGALDGPPGWASNRVAELASECGAISVRENYFKDVFVIEFPIPLNLGALASYGDYFLLAEPDMFGWAGPNGIGIPGAG